MTLTWAAACASCPRHSASEGRVVTVATLIQLTPNRPSVLCVAAML